MEPNSQQKYFYQQDDLSSHNKIFQLSLLKQIQIQPQQQILKSKHQNYTKSKGIEKTHRKTHSQPFLSQKKQARKTIGRPTNFDQELSHLLESRSYNNIIYHYSRFLIFLKIKQEKETKIHKVNINQQQKQWLSQTQKIMSLKNFPAYYQEKPVFLLHPNSLHFVFQYRINNVGKYQYSQEELKYNFYALLRNKGLLTESIFKYLNSYWHDIIYLVNNPFEDDQSQKGQRGIENHEYSDEISDQQDFQSNRLKISSFDKNKIETQKQTQKPRKRQNKENSQLESMKRELTEDDSIAAYEIVSYLHACCVKFQLKIITNN